jgi:hypothetical protein
MLFTEILIKFIISLKKLKSGLDKMKKMYIIIALAMNQTDFGMASTLSIN